MLEAARPRTAPAVPADRKSAVDSRVELYVRRVLQLENLEALEPEGLREDAQIELEELGAQLREQGFEATVAGLEESVHAHLQESAEQAFVAVLNVVLDHALDAVATLAIEEAVRRWARRRRRFRNQGGAKPVAYIYGPDGDVIGVVELPEPDTDPAE